MRFTGCRTGEILAFLLVSCVYWIAVVPAPGMSLPQAIHDDGLFMKWSVSLMQGDWLGPWDSLSTVKGPLHSILTAAAASLGINPFVYKRIFYWLASLVFVNTCLAKGPFWLRLLAFMALLVDPFQLSSAGLRNLRESTYIPLQLLGFGLGSACLDQLAKPRPGLRVVSLLFAATTACFSLILIAREARLIAWLEIGLWLGLLCLASRQLIGRLLRSRPVRASLALLLVLLATVAFLKTPERALSAINRHHYHYPISNSNEEGEFPRFYGRLITINLEGETIKPRVPISGATLRQLLAESGPDSDLHGILSRINTKGWEPISCHAYPDTCGEIGGGWFLWALREAAGLSLAPAAMEDAFQSKLLSAHQQLQAICETSTRLSCDKPVVGFMTPLRRWGFSDPLAEVRKEAISILLPALLPAANPFNEALLLANDGRGEAFRTLALPLAISAVQPSEAARWQAILESLRLLGAILKWSLLIVALTTFFWPRERRPPWPALRDPVCIWLLISLAAQLSLYTLVGLTSFSGVFYTSIASPLYLGLLARSSSVCLQASRIARVPAQDPAPP